VSEVKFNPHPLGLNLLEWAERNELVRLLAKHGGKVAAVADEIPLGRQTVYNRIKVLQITPEDWAKAVKQVPADFEAVASYLEDRVLSRLSARGVVSSQGPAG
jgi:hypothetical protein